MKRVLIAIVMLLFIFPLSSPVNADCWADGKRYKTNEQRGKFVCTSRGKWRLKQ